MVAHHLLTGSYTNSSLFLLAFDTVAKTLTLNQTIPAFGLHQFVTTNAARDVVYATTMSEPPRLFSWAMSADYKFTHLNTVDISKYIVVPEQKLRIPQLDTNPTQPLHRATSRPTGSMPSALEAQVLVFTN